MGKKEREKEDIIIDKDNENIQEYDKMLNTLKNDVDKLKSIKRRKKKIRKLQREKKEIMKKINKNN
ncbi:hypothetical protein [Clostridium sp. KNHs214]|uniref:hypothetical protein n=1 Tax=Clostridium sp. KNHs214 TaxID=1540257 RepID=UPI000557A686|nr:hypothetical protein [Clostridium sp. KNHs214]